jgi:SET domain-containing protein
VKIRVRVGRSRIAGTGVFAAQPIQKGTRILEYTGEKISRQDVLECLAQLYI